ncbi:MAG: hypothetical protein PHX21_11880 [bacterium]|nr:hypothetical protein [bacterium]
MLLVVAVTTVFGSKNKSSEGNKSDTNAVAVVISFLSTDNTQVILISTPIADTAKSQVKIKWSENSRVFARKEISRGYLVFTDTTFPTPSISYTIELNSNLGNSIGSITLPESTAITAPQVKDTLPLGEPVNFSWTAAQGAEYYNVRYYAYAYNDSGYNSCPEQQFYPTSNAITIPVSYFNVPGTTYYDVYLSVTPCAGTIPQTGQTENMMGTIKGFMLAEGDCSSIEFYVGTPPMKGATKEEFVDRIPPRKDRINSYLSDLGINKVVK